MGLGGGFLMTIYDAKTETTTFLDARETAPSLANETIFVNKPHLALQGKIEILVSNKWNRILEKNTIFDSKMLH